MVLPKIALLTSAIVAVSAVAAGPVPAAVRPPAVAESPASAPSAVADAATAVEWARRTGKPVEILGERTETAQFFANPSGTRTLQQHATPQRARKDGAWVPIDTRLTRAADGSVTPGATVVGLRLSGGTGPLVRATVDDTELALSWPGPLPAPVLAGDTATYPEVLPGIDLRVRVTAEGFAQLLVVKDAVAAANPALRRIAYQISTKGLTLRPTPDGGGIAVNARGETVLVSGVPTMWDSTAAGPEVSTLDNGRPAAGNENAAPRHATMRLEHGPAELAVVPDHGMLTDPHVRYPVYIDPSYSTARLHWTLINHDAASTPYWTDAFYREDVRVGAVYNTGQGPWRAFFHFNIAPLARATISRAWFAITLTHSADCTAQPVGIWHTKTLDPSTSVTWNNSSGSSAWFGEALEWVSGKANLEKCGQQDMPMEFGLANSSIKPLVQEAVNGAAGPQEAIGFGLRNSSANEHNTLYWKRFSHSSAKLIVEYNTPPHAPSAVSTVPPSACGTATAPTPLGTTTPSFSGIGYDPNGDNVGHELELLSGETVLYSSSTGTTGSGSAFSWPVVPSGTLPADQPTVYSYRARSRDATLAGPYGTRCYFTVDTARPAAPAVTSADFPGLTPVRSVGEIGHVTFARAAADADVAGFRYGFSQSATTMWVAAGADGTATVPITLWPSTPGDTSDVRRTLYVRAVDRAGNTSLLTPGRDLVARGRSVTAAPVRADVNGDRSADVTAVVDHGSDRTAVWNLLATPSGFEPGYIAWDSEISGGVPVDRIRSTTGDFDGDGRTDLAIYREDPDQQARLFLLRSDGSRYTADGTPVWTGAGFRLSHVKIVAGDVDGDGDDDLALLQGTADGQLKLWIHRSAGGQFAGPVQEWSSATGYADLRTVHLVAGDFDGDGDDDVADIAETTGGVGKLQVHAIGQGVSATPALRWDGGSGTLARDRTRFLTANVDGAGNDEIVAAYDATLRVLVNNSGSWTAAGSTVTTVGAFDTATTTLAAGDFNADGRGDIAALVDIGAGRRRLNSYRSNGTGFIASLDNWTGYVSETTAAVRIDPARKFRIHPVHTGKCFDVPGNSTTNGAVIDQWDCVTTAHWEQFRFVRVGATPYFELRTTTNLCLEIPRWSLLDNTNLVQWTCGSAGSTHQPNQQFQLDLLASSGWDLVVQIRNVHAGKCLHVSGASTANGAPIVQTGCTGAPPANRQFHLRIEP